MELTQFSGKILDFSLSTTVYKYVKKIKLNLKKHYLFNKYALYTSYV